MIIFYGCTADRFDYETTGRDTDEWMGIVDQLIAMQKGWGMDAWGK